MQWKRSKYKTLLKDKKILRNNKNSNDFRSNWVETEQQKDKCKESNEMGINDIFKLNTLLLITIFVSHNSHNKLL